MKRLPIDFVQPPLWRLPASGRARRLLAGIAVLVGLGVLVLVWYWRQLEQQIDQVRQEIAVARQEVQRRTPPPPPPLLLTDAQVLATNHAIAQLNTPWPALLDGFERVATPDIALLQIEPDPRRRVVKGVGEAKNHQQMLLYLAALGAVEPFAGAMVSKQEVNEKDPNRPLRFLFEAALAAPSLPAVPGSAAGAEAR